MAEPPVPTSVAFPALAPEVIIDTIHEFEVLQVAEVVTFVVVLSENAASAENACCCWEVNEGELGLTVTDVGAFTKNPLHPLAVTSETNPSSAKTTLTFSANLSIISNSSVDSENGAAVTVYKF